jgi:hypothetical protein
LNKFAKNCIKIGLLVEELQLFLSIPIIPGTPCIKILFFA